MCWSVWPWRTSPSGPQVTRRWPSPSWPRSSSAARDLRGSCSSRPWVSSYCSSSFISVTAARARPGADPDPSHFRLGRRLSRLPRPSFLPVENMSQIRERREVVGENQHLILGGLVEDSAFAGGGLLGRHVEDRSPFRIFQVERMEHH